MRGYLQGLMYGGAAMVLGLGGLSYVMPARVEMPPPPPRPQHPSLQRPILRLRLRLRPLHQRLLSPQ